ncbi:hypothetical protein VCHC55A1_1278, partial [Vibrio cholerae HC-55A1]
MIFLSL